MLYSFEFDFREGLKSESHGHFKINIEGETADKAKEKALKLIIEATENDCEFFESGSIIWLKRLKSIENETLEKGTIFDFIDSSTPEISKTYPGGSVIENFNEGMKGNEVKDAEPFFVIP